MQEGPQLYKGPADKLHTLNERSHRMANFTVRHEHIVNQELRELTEHPETGPP